MGPEYCSVFTQLAVDRCVPIQQVSDNSLKDLSYGP